MIHLHLQLQLHSRSGVTVEGEGLNLLLLPFFFLATPLPPFPRPASHTHMPQDKECGLEPTYAMPEIHTGNLSCQRARKSAGEGIVIFWRFIGKKQVRFSYVKKKSEWRSPRGLVGEGGNRGMFRERIDKYRDIWWDEETVHRWFNCQNTRLLQCATKKTFNLMTVLGAANCTLLLFYYTILEKKKFSHSCSCHYWLSTKHNISPLV